MGCSICKEKQAESAKSLHKEPSQVPRTFRSIYAMGDEIGSGAYATVRDCMHRTTKEKFAVKCVLRKGLTKQTEDAFREEVRIMRLLDSPYVVKCHDFFEEDDYFFLVEELIEGGEVFDRISEKHVYNEKEARDLIRILLYAVQYCHSKDIVHRDLKLENLLLASQLNDHEIKLADFGFATFVKDDHHSLIQYCGTRGYIAPEIVEHTHYGKPVDMWSVGVIAYCLLGGHPPFAAENDDIEMEKIKNCDYEFDQEHWWAVSDGAKDLIRHLLCHDPDDRFTVEQALQHEWVTCDEALLIYRKLHGSLENMKKAKKDKLKELANTVISINRLNHVINNKNRADSTDQKDVQNKI